MKIVYKYPIYTYTSQIDMPEGAQLLSVKMQDGNPCLWALVDPDRPMRPRGIYAAPTGAYLPDEVSGYTFVDTVLMEGGALVFHIFIGPEI